MTSDLDIFSSTDDAEIPLCDIAELSTTLAKNAPPVVARPPSGKDLRTVQRYLVRWRVTAAIDAEGLHHGIIKDISIKGAAVLLEQNLQSIEYIKLHIYVPPPPPSKFSCIIEVLGKVAYSIYDAKEQRFRIGISFLKFGTEHDPVFLEKHLDNHTLRAVF